MARGRTCRRCLHASLVSRSRDASDNIRRIGDVAALVVAMLAGLVTSLAVTVVWQISIHNAVAGGTAMILLLAFGPAAIPALVVPAAIGW